jgi:hypothetical protein
VAIPSGCEVRQLFYEKSAMDEFADLDSCVAVVSRIFGVPGLRGLAVQGDHYAATLHAFINEFETLVKSRAPHSRFTAFWKKVVPELNAKDRPVAGWYRRHCVPFFRFAITGPLVAGKLPRQA